MLQGVHGSLEKGSRFLRAAPNIRCCPLLIAWKACMPSQWLINLFLKLDLNFDHVFFVFITPGPSCIAMCDTIAGSYFSTGMLVCFVNITKYTEFCFSFFMVNFNCLSFHPEERYCSSGLKCQWPIVETTESYVGSHLGSR